MPSADYDTLTSIADNISGIESGGNYGAKGPVTKTGDRAFGKYQVMGANIPSWTRDALGKSLTPDEFLASPDAQEATAIHQMGQIYSKYPTPGDVASVWHSGQPLAKSAGRGDQLGTKTSDYAARVARGVSGQTSVRGGRGVGTVHSDPETELTMMAEMDPEAELAKMAEPEDELAAIAGSEPDEGSTGRGALGSLVGRTAGRALGAVDSALGHLPSDAAAYAGAQSAGDEKGAQEALTRHGGTGRRVMDVGLGLLEMAMTGKYPGAVLKAAGIGSAAETASGSKEAGDAAELVAGVAPGVAAVGRAGMRGAKALMGGKSAAEEVVEGLGAQSTAQDVGEMLQAPKQGGRAAITRTAQAGSRMYDAAGEAARDAGSIVPASDKSIITVARQAVRDAKDGGRPLSGPARRVVANLVKLGRTKGVGPATEAGVRPPSIANDVPVEKLIEAQSNLRREITRLPFDHPGRSGLIDLSKSIDDAMEAATQGTPVGERLGAARDYYRQTTIPTRKTASRVINAETPEQATRTLTGGKTPTRFNRVTGAVPESAEPVRSAFFNDLVQGAMENGKINLRRLSTNLAKAESTGQLSNMGNTTARRNTIRAIEAAAKVQRAAAKAPVIGGGTGALGGMFGLGAGYAGGRIVEFALRSEKASRALLRLSQAHIGSPGWTVAKSVLDKAIKTVAPSAASTARSGAGMVREANDGE